MAKLGRPSDYKPEYDEQVRKICALGADDKKLADFFNVSESTLNLWKLKHPTFSESLRSGKREHDSIKVEDSLLKRALGYEWVEEKQEDGTNGSKTTTTNKHVPPDATSMIFWLKNRNPNRWKDKQEIEQNSTVTVKKGLGDFYPDIKDE